MQHTLILGRPASGKTTKAIEVFQANKDGLFFTQEQTKEDLIKKVGIDFKEFVFDDCNSGVKIIQKINTITKKIDFIVVDYLQLFSDFDIPKLIQFLDTRDIKLVLISYIDKDNNIKSIYWNDGFKDLFDKIVSS